MTQQQNSPPLTSIMGEETLRTKGTKAVGGLNDLEPPLSQQSNLLLDPQMQHELLPSAPTNQPQGLNQ